MKRLKLSNTLCFKKFKPILTALHELPERSLKLFHCQFSVYNALPAVLYQSCTIQRVTMLLYLIIQTSLMQLNMKCLMILFFIFVQFSDDIFLYAVCIYKSLFMQNDFPYLPKC